MSQSPVKSTLPNEGWQASLDLGFEKQGDRTVLRHYAHFGPLRVQRPFYPEDNGCCHIYLLHPPGGLVPGDTLHIDINSAADCHSLFTTPSAGKVYKTDSAVRRQTQQCTIKISKQSMLEWLPQETIVFDGAAVELSSCFELEEDAQLIGWDMICLGRPSSKDWFTQGFCRQRIEIWRNKQPVFIERSDFQGGSPLMTAPWGMHNFTTTGVMFATIELSKTAMDRLRQELPETSDKGHWSLTQRDGILLCRYLGHSAEHGKKGFEKIWHWLRPKITKQQVVRPRIWNT